MHLITLRNFAWFFALVLALAMLAWTVRITPDHHCPHVDLDALTSTNGGTVILPPPDVPDAR